MPIDLTTLSPRALAHYVQLGQQFSSADTLAQANQTLKGLATYGAELVKHGFALTDGARLKAARDALIAAGVGRADAHGARKVTNQAYLKALREGKAQRENARAILENTARALEDSGAPEAEAGIGVIQSALSQAKSAGVDASKLADQLDLLRNALDEAAVAAEAVVRGGPEAVKGLTWAAERLRAAHAERSGVRGTPAETEHLDLLDGIIVTLVRGARKAARAAARRLGQPALLVDFELSKIYSRRKSSPMPEPEARSLRA